MKPSPNNVEQLLREQHRWNQYAWPLAAVAAGFAATLVVLWQHHPSLVSVEKWGRLPEWWLGGVAATLAVAAAIYLFRRKSVLQSARTLDTRWETKNRLETAAALSSAPDALARAQREETAAFVGQTQLRSRKGWLTSLSGLVVLLALAHLFILASWARSVNTGAPGGPDKLAAQGEEPAKPDVAEKPTPAAKPAAVPVASIVWNSPESEIKAAAVEEVPLEAVADSTSGFQDAVLEISVNGVEKTHTSIELAELKTAGRHTVQTSLYMDQLGVKPYDIVSYSIRAQVNGTKKSGDTVSPVQFVEIKPLREDVKEGAPTQNPSQCFNYITAIKSAQLRAMKRNFDLAHSELSHGDSDWQDENRRLGADQKTLAEKTGEVVDLLVSIAAPEEITSLVRAARPEMDAAAEKITATENEPALAPQGKALALITQVEKYLGRSVRQGRPLVQKVPDPFDKKALELKRRDETPAGELEVLAREQARLADDLAVTNTPAETPADGGKADPQKITGTASERESQINQRVGTLLQAANLPAEVTPHLAEGRKQTQMSLLSLGLEDVVAAREPAAAAARELRVAADTMKRIAEQVAKNELADALRALSDAAGGARITPAQLSDEAARQQATNVMNQVQNAARNLTAAARQQQETGSARAAAQLNALAKALADPDMQKALQQLREQPRDPEAAQNAANKIQDVADQAGLMRRNGPLSPTELAQLADRLERAHANIQRLTAQRSAARPPAKGSGSSPGNATGSTGGFAAEIISDVREATLEALPALPQSTQLADLRVRLRGTPGTGADDGKTLLFLDSINPPLEGVIRSLREAIQDSRRQYRLNEDAVAEAPPAYRPAVANYFEQVSKDYQAASPPAGK